MASFCMQCSFDIWGHDDEDMKGASTEEDTRKGLFAIVLCEDCGPCQVDHTGKCISDDCYKKHGLNNDHPEKG